MQKNMGSADSFIRTMLGISFLVNIIILEPGITGTIILLVLGAMNLGTAWIGYCPAYKPFGICTCDDKCCTKTEKSA